MKEIQKTTPLRGFGYESPRMGKDEWLTPPHVFRNLGTFDLDPCAPINRPWDTARRHLTVVDDGLAHPWAGRVWLNPPYGRALAAWMQRMAAHNDGTALIFARTETAMFFDCVWSVATAVFFLRGRLTFLNVDGSKPVATAGSPSVLVAYGRKDADWLRGCELPGKFISLR